MRSLHLARQHASSEHERLVYEGWILYDTGHCEEGLRKAEESIKITRSFEAFFLKAYALADSSQDTSCSSTVVSLLENALKCPSDRLRKGQVSFLVPMYVLYICSGFVFFVVHSVDVYSFLTSFPVCSFPPGHQVAYYNHISSFDGFTNYI